MTISPNSSQHHHRGRLRQGSRTGIEAGHVIAFRREDGASMLRYQIAKGKASGALGLGVSSPKIGEMALAGIAAALLTPQR